MTMKINPDLAFIDDVVDAGGGDVKKCFQCATCSMTCPLSPDDHPYPRKEMIWASWGLKEQLVADPDIWLCHQCGDCNTRCPRTAQPGDVMASLRINAIEHFAVPRFMARMMRSAKYLPLLILISSVFLGLMVLTQYLWMGWHEGIFAAKGFEYEEFLKHRVINIFFPTAFFTAMGLAGVGALRFWKAIDGQAKDWGDGQGKGLVASFIAATIDLLLHNRFDRCDEGKPRLMGHRLVFFGFFGLMATTAGATILTVLEMDVLSGLEGVFAFLDTEKDIPGNQLYPLPWLHPLKMVGNLTGLTMVLGSLYVIAYRMRETPVSGKSTYSDWLFVALVLTVGLTGFGAEIARLEPLSLPLSVGIPVYMLHLSAVFWLLIFFPFSKFAHALYRYLAMVHAHYRGRTLPAVQ